MSAIAIAPGYAAAHLNLGNAHVAKSDWGSAVEEFRKAVALCPEVPELYINLGGALECDYRWAEALEVHSKAVALRPDDAGIQNHYGAALYWAGRFDEAEAAHRRALEIAPNLATAHCLLSSVYIVRGDLLRGYREWEWRFQVVGFPPGFTKDKFWDGGDLAGRRVILQTEGGRGDAIHYFRYAPMVAARNGKVIVRCRPEMTRLFQTLQGVAEVVGEDQPIPEYDLHCPLFSLPVICKTTLETIPAQIPYLKPEPSDAARWKARLAAVGDKRVNVGLVWAGSPDTNHDRTRTMSLIQFAPLTEARGVRFFSLQKGKAAAESKNPPAGMELIDWSAELNDWSDTAALLANLDLLVTVDTAPAHLAGAMGKPVWMLLEKTPAQVWMLDRPDSPWYPTMRLFRQRTAGDWSVPLNEITGELRNLLAKKSS